MRRGRRGRISIQDPLRQPKDISITCRIRQRGVMSIREQAGFATAVLWTAISLYPDPGAAQEASVTQYRVLATNKTSTMQREMDTAAAAGFRFGHVMGGPTAGGGSEVVVIMTKASEPGNFEYRLL